MFYLKPPRHISTLPFSTESNQQQSLATSAVPPKAEVNSELSRHSDVPLRVDGAARDVIQAPKPEPRNMRYELSDYEWTAIKPMLPNKPRCAKQSGLVYGA